MSPELVGLIVGLAFIFPAIYVIRLNGFETQAWPIILATLPIYYMLFAVLAGEGAVVLSELICGLLYFAIGLLVWRMDSKITQRVIAVAWLSHGLYDDYHDMFFVNPGVFNWYPAFCALVDIGVGLYLLAVSNRKGADTQHQ